MAAGGKRRSFYADLDHMRSLFDSVDTSETGFIGIKELCVLVRSIPGIEEAAVPELMERLDRDRDGKVTFDDFEVLFAQEREEIKKKRKLNPSTGTLSHTSSDSDTSPHHHNSESGSEQDLSQSFEYNTALEQLPSIQEISVSPKLISPKSSSSLQREDSFTVPESPTVILRHKLPRRATLPARFEEAEHFSPIHATRQKRPPSNELPDLATQMRYLTDISSSPQLKRGSKVLSWISESGEMFDLEGTGQLYSPAREMSESDGLPSPPLSPMRSGDEASNFKGILESVCHTDKIGKEAISQLCKHVKADPQEESELLTLLTHLDKDKVGYVGLDEFVRGLQFIRNAAVVTSTPPPNKAASLRRAHSEIIPPPYFGTPTSSLHPPPPFLASTPLPAGAMYTTDTSALLTVLDPDHSGVVKVDNLISQWQQMGVEAPHDTSLEDALSEVVSIDPAGRVNVGELATSLEGALLSEENKANVLRQVALKLYKTEISTLRTQVHHVSLERDTIRSSLNRTLEENKRLVKEGDEHADLVQQQSEQRLKEAETQLTDLLYKEKRSREEEARQMQERAATMIKEMEKKLEALRGEEEVLRQSLKLKQDECNLITNELQKANRSLDQKDRTIQMLQRDLGYRSELDLGVDETHLSRLRELEDDVTEKTELVANLREGMTEMQDKYDLLVAENEKLKQKYFSQKRSLLRRNSPGDVAKAEKRHSIGDRPARPLSGSLYGRTRRRKPRQPSISYKLDLATEGSHHPILWEEEKLQGQEENSGSSEEMEEAEPEQPVEQCKEEEEEAIDKPMSEESTPDEDDFFARSTTSLMQELLVEKEKNMLENKIEQLRKEKTQLIDSYEQLEQQMKMTEASHKDELHRQHEQNKYKQQELEEYITVLEKLRQNLLANQMEVDCQVTDEIPKQLPNVKSSQSNSDGNMSILIDELDHSRSQLEEERNTHAEAVASLKQQLAKLEEYSDFQTDQCLKLEEEKARAEGEVATLQQQLDSQRQSSETRINALMLKLENLEKSHAEFEMETENRSREMQAELSNVYEKVKEFKEKSTILEAQLKDAEEIIRNRADVEPEVIVTKEVVNVDSTDQSVQVKTLKISLDRLQAEYAQVSQLNEQLQKDNVKMYDTEKRMLAEILDLQKQLSAVEKELNDQSEVYTNEISRLKEDMEKEKEGSSEKTAIQLEEMHSSLMKLMDESVQKYELKLEMIKQEMRASEHRENSLQEKLIESGVQFEKLVSKVADLTQSEAKWQKHAIDLEHSQSQYLSEVSQLKGDNQKYLEELSHLQTKETWYNETISSLQNELDQRTNFEDEIDFVPVPATHHSPYKSDSEAQGKLITQMKSRLEELQRLLLKSSRSDSSETPNAELGLVQELLANNIALDSAAKLMRRDFEAKNQELSEFLARKDSELNYFQSEMDKEQKALETLTASNMHQLLNRMDAFHGNSNKSLDKYRVRIEAAAAMLESIRMLVHDQDQRHINALESALSDLDQSQSEVCSYKDEVEKLKAQLDQSHHYDAEQEQSTSNGLMIATETSPSPGASKRRVDEGSGQLIDSSSEIDDVQCRQSLLQQKDNEIKTLRDELDYIKRMEKHTRTMIEGLEQDLVEGKHELLRKATELQQKETVIKELEGKLNAVAGDHEPIEAVVQYVEKQPLEGVNETVATGMEDVRLEADLNSSPDEAKELVELRQALKTIEAALMESRQAEVTLKLCHETNIEELIMKHAAELSATQKEIQSNTREVQRVYLSLIDEDDSLQDTAIDGLTHSQLALESRNMIESLKQQLKHEQVKSSDLESTLLSKMEEHDQLDAQFQAEHEEEVRALRQQKHQLARQLEELKSHYQQSINEQDNQNSILLQELANSKDDMEKQLKEKTEEAYHVYQQVADLMEEKKVLMDIVHQLCVEAGRQIDVV